MSWHHFSYLWKLVKQNKKSVHPLEVKEINDKLFRRLMRKLIKIWNIHEFNLNLLTVFNIFWDLTGSGFLFAYKEKLSKRWRQLLLNIINPIEYAINIYRDSTKVIDSSMENNQTTENRQRRYIFLLQTIYQWQMKVICLTALSEMLTQSLIWWIHSFPDGWGNPPHNQFVNWPIWSCLFSIGILINGN